MGKNKRVDRNEPLDRLLAAADAGTLRQLVNCLANTPEMRRTCLEFLRERQSEETVSPAETDAEIVRALWDELMLDLEELEEYGGGDYDTVDHVDDLLYELSGKLTQTDVPVDARREHLDEVMPYIRSGNSGLVDSLYEVAYSTCKTDDDWHDFAERLEATGQDWPWDHARRIYRRIGDREKFLELRSRRMELGADYHDLATFYWESGEKEEALAVAWEGIEQASGRMDELREFLAERAIESGDRSTFLELEFAQATDRLSPEKYKKFRKLCSKSEWAEYQPRMMKHVSESYSNTRIQIYMHRKDFGAAVEVLSASRYPNSNSFGFDSANLKAAEQLEEKFPEKVLAYYLTGLRNLDRTATRKQYAHLARCAKLARRVWVDVLKKPAEWETFARKIKLANARRLAFQQEFSKAVPGWNDL